jgi:hypothetical protein
MREALLRTPLSVWHAGYHLSACTYACPNGCELAALARYCALLHITSLPRTTLTSMPHSFSLPELLNQKLCVRLRARSF